VTDDDIGPDLLKEEIQAAMSEMKNNKAEGYDGIPIEMLQCLGDVATDFVLSLCQKIYTSGIWPEDFVKTVIIH